MSQSRQMSELYGSLAGTFWKKKADEGCAPKPFQSPFSIICPLEITLYCCLSDTSPTRVRTYLTSVLKRWRAGGRGGGWTADLVTSLLFFQDSTNGVKPREGGRNCLALAPAGWWNTWTWRHRRGASDLCSPGCQETPSAAPKHKPRAFPAVVLFILDCF